MSLTLTFHNKDFGIVCCDGRVSMRAPDGRLVAMPQETAKKFRVLRASPGLVLAGSSGLGRPLDFSIYDAVCRHVQEFPESSFDQVAGIIMPAADAARAACEAARATLRVARSVFFAEVIALNLLGYDRERECVRNRVFAWSDHGWDVSEHESGLTTAGCLEPEERSGMADRFVGHMRGERTLQAVVDAMLSLAGEISSSRPETVGPPYSLHLVTKGPSRGGSRIEEEFGRALAASKNHAPSRVSGVTPAA